MTMRTYLRHVRAVAATWPSVTMLGLALFCLVMAGLVALHVIRLRTRNHSRVDYQQRPA